MTVLRDVRLCDDALALCAGAINRHGEASHPYADESTIGGFAADYAAECLARSIPHMSPPYADLARDAIEQIRLECPTP